MLMTDFTIIVKYNHNGVGTVVQGSSLEHVGFCCDQAGRGKHISKSYIVTSAQRVQDYKVSA